ncbi:hypothetical protein VRU48_09865 [Pedobacter sp. KR3-3]|uniref:Fibronectin type-III domain-containing protein n=1 Tax=Pedobacter albus TaxID=3113905 RepID=A0ABU7I860_9SPHI|nr:hypothetical protein [Pedobacter sp. KR3-3]MEE1945414.1 hypothetical protein [Pedobacter sp. KR3-3]
MRTLIYICLSFVSLAAFAQPSARPASKGIYLNLGNELPVNFRYVISRKATGDKTWKQVGETSFPNSSIMLKARLMTADPILRQGQLISDTAVKVLWRRAEGALFTDSIRPYHEMPLYASAVGVGYLDTTATPGAYEYRIYKRDADDANIDSATLAITYRPAKLPNYLIPVSYEAADEAVSISYQYPGTEKLGGIKVLRSRFGYNQFEQIPVFTIFSKVNDSLTARITDQTAAYKMAYQYIAIPFDELGNEGEKSDTLYVYNNSRTHDIGFFKAVSATAVDKDKAIVLKWKLSSPGDVTAVKIYKSYSWDGEYALVGTANVKDTVWADIKVKPMVTYYYRLQAQGPYSSSVGSTRVQALMKAPRKLVFPPRNLSAESTGNTVKLTFRKVDRDARGYYVYRSEGYNGMPVQLSRLLLSKDSLLVYQDTIKNNLRAGIYTYTVATINTSYEISPPSDRASVMLSGQIPVPAKVKAQLSKEQALVFWNDMTKENNISGYIVYRSEKLENEENYGEMKKMADLLPETNSYVDSTLAEGHHYAYYIQCKGIGNDGADTGGLSQVATVHYNAQKLMPPNNVIALAQTDGIALTWNNPLGIPLTKVKIYRGKANGELQLLKELSANEKDYVDTGIEKETTYFYTLSIIDSRGKESVQTSPLGVRSK